MKKLLLLASIVVASMSVSPPVHAATCFSQWCDWVVNGRFSNGATGWDKSENTTFPYATGCWGTSRVAQVMPFRPAAGWLSQRMHPDYGTVYSVEFDLYLLDETNTWFDQLKVTVTDLTTGAKEERVIRGDQYNSICPQVRQVFSLSNNYINHDVELKFAAAGTTTGTFQIDNVNFWSGPS